MPRLADVPAGAVAAALRGEGLSLDFGAARVRIRADVDGLADAIRCVYGEYPHDERAPFHDVALALHRRRGLRRVVGAQIEAVADADVLFEPFPAATHLPLLEWSLNYLLAQRLQHRLLLHAGVVALDDRALVMPALPGSGKSTLTAALASSGWRLLSDEFGIVGLDDGLMHPMPRPIALKEASIDVVAAFAPHAVIGPRFPGTRKGTVAHVAPDARSVAARHTPAAPALLVFPHFLAGAAVRVEPMPRARAFAKLSVNSFNYEVLGPDGFEAVGALVARCTVHRLSYGDVGAAVGALRELLARAPLAEPA